MDQKSRTFHFLDCLDIVELLSYHILGETSKQLIFNDASEGCVGTDEYQTRGFILGGQVTRGARANGSATYNDIALFPLELLGEKLVDSASVLNDFVSAGGFT